MKSIRKKMVILLLISALVIPLMASVTAAQESLDPKDKVPTLKFLTATPSYDRNRYESSMMITENMKKLGLDVSLQPTDMTVLNAATRSKPWDFNCFMHQLIGRIERIDPDRFLYDNFHSSQAGDKGNNKAGLTDPVYDKLAEAQRREMDPEKRRALIFKCQEYLHEQAFYFPVWFQELFSLGNKERFKGYVALPGEGVFSEWTPIMVEPLTKDKVLRIVNNADIANLNPLSSTSVWNWKILRMVYDKLARVGPDMTAVPAAAKEWKIVSPTVIDVTVRSGMTFHDGKPVTVDDVKFTYDLFQKWPCFLKSFVEPIKSVTVLDKTRLRFTLDEPYAPFVITTFCAIPILPKHIWEGLKNPDDWQNTHPIGSGPFKFIHWRKGEEVKLDRFAAHYTPPKIDSVLYIIVGSDEGVLGALETKSADMSGWDMKPAHIEMAQKMPHLQVFKVLDHGYTYFSANVRRPPFNDLKFRQAIAHIFDYKTLVNVLLDGKGTPGGAGRVVSPSVKDFYTPGLPEWGYSLEKAREKLKAAGYRWDSKGKLYYPKKS